MHLIVLHVENFRNWLVQYLPDIIGIIITLSLLSFEQLVRRVFYFNKFRFGLVGIKHHTVRLNEYEGKLESRWAHVESVASV